MDVGEKRIALLIDADNAPAVQDRRDPGRGGTHGVANVRRAYGNWKSPHLKAVGGDAALLRDSPDPAVRLQHGKNASDMAMVIDAMDLLYARSLDAFAIVSSDADFTPAGDAPSDRGCEGLRLWREEGA